MNYEDVSLFKKNKLGGKFKSYSLYKGNQGMSLSYNLQGSWLLSPFVFRLKIVKINLNNNKVE